MTCSACGARTLLRDGVCVNRTGCGRRVTTARTSAKRTFRAMRRQPEPLQRVWIAAMRAHLDGLRDIEEHFERITRVTPKEGAHRGQNYGKNGDPNA